MDFPSLAAAALCYLLGAIPFSYLAGRLKGLDVRQHGSGNVGATNVTRVVGVGYGVLALVGDVGKGALAAWLVSAWHVPWWVAGFSVIGHNWSIFLKFTGGKGVATTVGLMVGFALWPVLLATVAIWIVTVLLTQYIAVGSIVALLLAPGVLYLFPAQANAVNIELIGLFFVLGLLTVWQHRSNIFRIAQGTEGRVFKKRSSSSQRVDRK
ncbi:MAG: glycerol-3-phosphate 1-O-acyltransferase PlsY [Candidatus Bipolaricaulota bacterium]|nr:glycerol-3-phosphate 1-O-acyltransferase PlsY [Candidatus Bipolaricaulota bacterium]